MENNMEKRPLIFITNDDGYASKGFAAIIEVARRHGRVVAIAPEHTQSGMSHAITMFSPLYLRPVREEEGLQVYACSGTPVDCVKMAYDYLLVDDLPDLNISGINHGSNSAISVLYSGTMGAAMEASFYGSPSIGLSLTDHSADADFDATCEFADKLIGKILADKPATPLCLNVNVPIARPEEIKGHRVCRQTRGYWKEEFYCRKDPRGKDYFWLTGDFANAEPEAQDTDEWALKNGYIAIVPVQVDMTDYQRMDEMKKLL